jgi:hypothetical protein
MLDGFCRDCRGGLIVGLGERAVLWLSTTCGPSLGHIGQGRNRRGHIGRRHIVMASTGQKSLPVGKEHIPCTYKPLSVMSYKPHPPYEKRYVYRSNVPCPFF